MWCGLRRRRWRVRVVACLVMVAGLVCAGVAPRPAVADPGPEDPAYWSTGSHEHLEYPERGGVWGLHSDLFENDGGSWRDGWCRRGERGFAVVVDFSAVPSQLRGMLTSAHARQFGPTVRDGWIVRCHEGLFQHYEGDGRADLDEGFWGVGLRDDYQGGRPLVPDSWSAGEDALLGTSVMFYPYYESSHQAPPTDKDHLYGYTIIGIRPDEDGALPGWPKQGTAMQDPWSGKIPQLQYGSFSNIVRDSDVWPGSIVYVSYGGAGVPRVRRTIRRPPRWCTCSGVFGGCGAASEDVCGASGVDVEASVCSGEASSGSGSQAWSGSWGVVRLIVILVRVRTGGLILARSLVGARVVMVVVLRPFMVGSVMWRGLMLV